MSELYRFLKKGSPIDEYVSYLNSLSQEKRINEMYQLPPGAQEDLFRVAKKGLTLNDLLPKNLPPYKPVIFYGINSLKACRKFQKRFCRTDNNDYLIGYNHQPMSWLTGPGYYIVTEKSDREGDLLIDYSPNIAKTPESWPKYKSSNCGISRLVYGGLRDYLRRVSEHVFIGEAVKSGKKVGYFMLCREE